ncbi:hypothetical protein O9992_21790 [Vibrio lentus]|nr:hypothetical protein [Vibrio lentus]
MSCRLTTSHLNSYSKMKDRLAKQEMMFAKYASRRLETPIAIVLGAAELRSHEPNICLFQTKQRERILGAANGMVTVEGVIEYWQTKRTLQLKLTVIDDATLIYRAPHEFSSGRWAAVKH